MKFGITIKNETYPVTKITTNYIEYYNIDACGGKHIIEPNTCLLQPIDRDYNKHNGTRQEHVEVKDDGVSHALRTGGQTLLAEPNLNEYKMLKQMEEKMENNQNVANMDLSQYRIRKLTPKECFRLMGVKDEDYENVAKGQSNASLYHLAGDSIVVSTLMAIFSQLFDIDWKEHIDFENWWKN